MAISVAMWLFFAVLFAVLSWAMHDVASGLMGIEAEQPASVAWLFAGCSLVAACGAAWRWSGAAL